MTHTVSSLTLVLVLSALGCATVESLKDPPELPVGGAADSAAGWVEHGEVVFDEDSQGSLHDGAAVHSWSFELDGEALVVFETLSAGSPNPDTVLHLLDVTDGGFEYAAPSNDDGGEGFFSRLDLMLGAGRYQVVVTGYSRAEEGPFVLRAGCNGGGCPGAAVEETCDALELADRRNPCSDGSICVLRGSSGFDGICRPATEIHDAAVGEFADRFGDQPELWPHDVTGGVFGVFSSDGVGASSISYVVQLSTAGRAVEFSFDGEGRRSEGVAAALFRIVPGPDARKLEVGAPTLFVTAPDGGTVESFLRELDEVPAEHLAYPLRMIDYGPSLVVLAARELHEVEAMAELQERFADHTFEYNVTHIATSGRYVRTLLAVVE